MNRLEAIFNPISLLILLLNSSLLVWIVKDIFFTFKNGINSPQLNKSYIGVTCPLLVLVMPLMVGILGVAASLFVLQGLLLGGETIDIIDIAEHKIEKILVISFIFLSPVVWYGYFTRKAWTSNFFSIILGFYFIFQGSDWLIDATSKLTSINANKDLIFGIGNIIFGISFFGFGIYCVYSLVRQNEKNRA